MDMLKTLLLFVTTFNYDFNGFYNVYYNIIHFKNNNTPSLISLKLLKHVTIKYNAYFKRIRGESQRYRKADEGSSRQQAVVSGAAVEDYSFEIWGDI